MNLKDRVFMPLTTKTRVKEYLVLAGVLFPILFVMDNSKKDAVPPPAQVVVSHVEPIKPPPVKKVHKTSDAECLASAIYHEARGESKSGQLAVGQVVLNRTKSDEFPDTVCKVVFQPHQFTGLHRIKYDHDTMLIAKRLMKKGANWFTDATHFHTIDSNPSWASNPNIVPRGQIGNHLFYKMG